MIKKFINFDAFTIFLLISLIVTIFAWMFFNLYYQNNQRAEVNQKLIEFSQKTYPNKYDEDFIREYYKYKDKIYVKNNKEN